MIRWLKRLFTVRQVPEYRVAGMDRRQEEEIKAQILRKMKRRMRDGGH